jgi:hypothetical protein
MFLLDTNVLSELRKVRSGKALGEPIGVPILDPWSAPGDS